ARVYRARLLTSRRRSGRRQLDLDPGAAPDAPGEPREEVEEPHLPSVLRPERRMRALDHPGVGHDAPDAVPPGALHSSARIAGGGAYPRRMAQPLDLPRLPGGDQVELLPHRRAPD